jgi:hypothetical protein
MNDGSRVVGSLRCGWWGWAIGRPGAWLVTAFVRSDGSVTVERWDRLAEFSGPDVFTALRMAGGRWPRAVTRERVRVLDAMLYGLSHVDPSSVGVVAGRSASVEGGVCGTVE